MSGKKNILATCLSASGVLPAVSRFRALRGGQLTVLAYHRIWDVIDESRFPFDVELISASIADFGWQMEYVRRNFDPITCRTALQILDGEIEAPPRPLIVTFDDGYDDNYHHAFPILQALGIPATVFVSTGYIGGESTFWYDQLTRLLLSAPECKLNLHGLEQTVVLSPQVSQRRQALNQLLKELKLIGDERRRDVLRQIEEKLGSAESLAPSTESRPMTWEQIREMSAAGIEFGSHTVSHPILANVSEQRLQFELQESKRAIEEQLGLSCKAISYPVGGASAFDQRVVRIAAESGYRLGFSYISGINSLRNSNLFALRRMHVERYTTRSFFAAMLNLPNIFH
jgi:peptidoglycan/xylan/chitin deacetylase (PgdA/CDA1 family)